MYNKVLTGILVVLIVGILGALGYLGYGYYKKIKLNADAAEYLEEFDEIIVQLSEENGENQDGNGTNTTSGTGSASGSTSGRITGGVSTDNLTYKGFKVVGKLEMPTINIQYPILDVITHAKAIEVSVGVLYGPGVNRPGNTVIIGHNYNNGLFFGRNKNLKEGEKIYITDLNGERKEYTIFSKYFTPESDTSYITRQTDGKIEVTLVTCDATGKNRLVVCARAE